MFAPIEHEYLVFVVNGNRGDVGTINILRNARNVGADGNVWLRVEQHYGIVEPNVNVTHHNERHSRRSSVGFYRDQQSRG